MKLWTFPPSSPWQMPVPTLNGVTEIRLQMLTVVGEIVFTYSIQEITWKGGENQPETGTTPWYKPVISRLQKHVPAPVTCGSKKSIIELGQLQRKEIQRGEASVIRSSQQETSKQGTLFSSRNWHLGKTLYSLGCLGHAQWCSPGDLEAASAAASGTRRVVSTVRGV